MQCASVASNCKQRHGNTGGTPVAPWRIAQGIVQPGREDQHAVAQGRAGQGLGHRRFDLFPALRTPVPVDRVLVRFDVRNIFGIPCTRLAAAIQRTAAIGTTIRLVIHLPIDVVRGLASSARMPLFSPRLLLATSRRRLRVRGLHTRRRRGSLVRAGRRGGFLLGQLLGQLQERKDDSFLALRENPARLLLGKRRAKRNVLCYRRHGIRTTFQMPQS